MFKKLNSSLNGKSWEEMAEEIDDFSLFHSFLGLPLEQFRSWIEAGDRILDIECGGEMLLDFFIDRGVYYVGLNDSPQLVDVAQKKYPSQQFILGNLFQVTFPSETFDKTFAFTFFQNLSSIEQQLRVLKEANRILKPNGLFFFQAWAKPRKLKTLLNRKISVKKKNSEEKEEHFLSKPGNIQKLVREAGLKIIQQEKSTLISEGEVLYYITQKS